MALCFLFMRSLTLRILPLVCFFVSAPLAQAIVIANFGTNTNDRFANDGSFIGDAFDWSGVGLDNSGKWGTLLSNNVFISANHSHPATSSTLTFYASNDSTGSSITRTVSSGQRLGTTDLWLGVLSAPVSSSYASYSFLSNDIADSAAFNSPSPVKNLISYVVGKSTTAWATSLDVAVGRNVLDAWVEDADAGGTTDDAIASFQGLPGTTEYHETLLQGGDSGAPLFVSVGGSLVLTLSLIHI